ncbi:MAG: hypothetical protein U1F54_12845 [Burkholderiales bacterium]
MTPLILLLAAVIAAALWWGFAGPRTRPRSGQGRGPKRTPKNFHCVEVRYPRNACEAVKRIGAKRFLPGEAPDIPVPGCDADKCDCRFVHHDDRRQGDRRNPYPLQAAGPPASVGRDRRTKRDRRRPPKAPGTTRGR